MRPRISKARAACRHGFSTGRCLEPRLLSWRAMESPTRSQARPRMASALLPLLVAFACTRDALPVNSDGGAPIVTGGETCDELRDRVAVWGAGHLACIAD